MIENNWTWVTGEEFSYTAWSSGQPDDYTGTETALMVYKNSNPLISSEIGNWNDLSSDGTCEDQEFFGIENFGFICEFESDILLPIIDMNSAALDKDNYVPGETITISGIRVKDADYVHFSGNNSALTVKDVEVTNSSEYQTMDNVELTLSADASVGEFYISVQAFDNEENASDIDQTTLKYCVTAEDQSEPLSWSVAYDTYYTTITVSASGAIDAESDYLFVAEAADGGHHSGTIEAGKTTASFKIKDLQMPRAARYDLYVLPTDVTLTDDNRGEYFIDDVVLPLWEGGMINAVRSGDIDVTSSETLYVDDVIEIDWDGSYGIETTEITVTLNGEEVEIDPIEDKDGPETITIDSSALDIEAGDVLTVTVTVTVPDNEIAAQLIADGHESVTTDPWEGTFERKDNSVITTESLQRANGTYDQILAVEFANIANEAYPKDYDTGASQDATTLAQNGFKNITYVDASLANSSFFESIYVGDIFDVEATVAFKQETDTSIIAVSFQGTSENYDWLIDAMASSQLAGIHDGFNAQVVEFLKKIDSIYFDTANGQKSMDELIDESKNGDSSISFAVTGHSMGAADAQVFTYYLLNAGVPSSAITTYTYASPIPFLKEYISPDMYEGATIYNVINRNDIVPMVGVAMDTPMDSSVANTLSTVLRFVEDVSNGKYDVDYVIENMLTEIQGLLHLYDMFMLSIDNILAENSGYSDIAQNIGENVYYTTSISSVEPLRDLFEYIDNLGDDLKQEFILRLCLSSGRFTESILTTVGAMMDDLAIDGAKAVEVATELVDSIEYNHKPRTYIDNANSTD